MKQHSQSLVLLAVSFLLAGDDMFVFVFAFSSLQ